MLLLYYYLCAKKHTNYQKFKMSNSIKISQFLEIHNLHNKPITNLKYQSLTIYYIHHNSQFYLISTYNHFKTFSTPTTLYLSIHSSLQSLIQSL